MVLLRHAIVEGNVTRYVEVEDPNFVSAPAKQEPDLKSEYLMASNKLDYIAKYLGLI